MPGIGLDIGGANLKTSDGQSLSISRPFAIWKEPQRLADELRGLLREMSLPPSPPLSGSPTSQLSQRGGEGRGEGPTLRGQGSEVRGQESASTLSPSPQPSPPLVATVSLESRERGRGSERHSSPKSQASSLQSLAVTMTAELADCFATKAEGVNFILDAVEEVADGREVLVWQTGGEFVSPAEARELVPLVAAANWHALATWAARLTLGAGDESALLIDLGSTTCDIIPLMNGLPVPAGLTDVERLQSGELVYTGVRRTPIVAVASNVPFRDVLTPLAAELFATMHDVYLLLGEIAEDANDTNTANGRPATIECAWDRIARGICCDRGECSLEEAREIARHLGDEQQRQVASAVSRVASRIPPPSHIMLSGEGEPILRRLIESLGIVTSRRQRPEILSLREMLGPVHSACACAYALARLARERDCR